MKEDIIYQLFSFGHVSLPFNSFVSFLLKHKNANLPYNDITYPYPTPEGMCFDASRACPNAKSENS